MSWTKAGVIVFVALLSFAAYDAWADPVISLGHTGLNSSSTVGEVAYQRHDWEAGLSLIGAGDTKKGHQDTVRVYSLSKLVRPDWCVLGGCNYYRIGIARVDSSPLVGPWNYRLGIGMDWGIIGLEYFHYSSAGIFETNTGIDGLQLRLTMPIR